MNLNCGEIMRLFDGEFPANEAKVLGTYLDVPQSKMKEFKVDNMGSVKGMLIDVLDYWLKTDPEKSWIKLAGALVACGYGALAEKIRQKSSS